MWKDLTSSNPVIFDLESDGLLDSITKIHCLVLRWKDGRIRFRGDGIVEGVKMLQNASCIIGHNIIDFDLPAIKKVLGLEIPKSVRVIDTLVLSRLCYPTRKDLDFSMNVPMDKKLYGRHSLKSWGYRLGVLKGEFGVEDEKAWAEWSQEMEDYCEQDTLVTSLLFDHLVSLEPSWAAMETEIELQKIICAQQRWGFAFDVQGAQGLAATLTARKLQLLEELQQQFPAKPAVCLGVYGNQVAKAGRLLEQWGLAGNPVEHRQRLEEAGIKFKWEPEVPFNPNSEKQVIERFMAMGWKPHEFTDSGQAKLDEPILLELGELYPEGKPLAEFALVDKRLGQIINGKNAWLKLVKPDGRMRGRCNTMGAISFRFSHSDPNMGQVPAVRSPYGKECRSLFHVGLGRVLVGCDVSGLELRILGHYMSAWDGGEYAREVVNGDVHTRNQKIAELETRDQAKTFIYALIYGAGDEKLGRIAKPNEKSQGILRKTGKALRARFLKSTPALKHLGEGVRVKLARQKKMTGLDGRILRARSVHSALNLLIQSAGAIVVKKATVIFRDLLEAQGHLMERDWCLVAHVHDEWQTECYQEIADDVRAAAIRSIELAGVQLGVRCPLTGEAKIGANWADTH